MGTAVVRSRRKSIKLLVSKGLRRFRLGIRFSARARRIRVMVGRELM